MPAGSKAEQLVRRLHGATDWRGEFELVDQWVANGADWNSVEQAYLLLAGLAPDPKQPAYRSLMDRIIARVALTPGRDNALFAWRLCRDAEASARLAQAQDWPDLEPLVRACVQEKGEALVRAAELVIEKALRGAQIYSDGTVRELWRLLARDGEPLAWLPPRRQGLERTLPLKMFGVSALSHGSAAEDGAPLEPNERSVALSQTSVSPTLERAMDVAFGGIRRRSNGKCAHAEYASTKPQSLDSALVNAVTAVFEPFVGSAARGVALPPETAVSSMLGLTMHGGAYGGGLGHVQGRLAGWKALAAMAGLSERDTFDSVAAAVGAAPWFGIEPSSDWFFNVAWDGCIGCVRANGAEVSVAAWTDTD